MQSQNTVTNVDRVFYVGIELVNVRLKTETRYFTKYEPIFGASYIHTQRHAGQKQKTERSSLVCRSKQL